MADKKAMTVKTPVFRGSFVNLAKPRKRDDDDKGEGKYSILIVLPKDKPSTKKFLMDIKKCIQKAYADKHGKTIALEDLRTRLPHYPIKNGDKMEQENFHGHWCINAASNFKPHSVDKTGEDLTTADDLYSGAWYRCLLSAWGWHNPKSGKGVSINLLSAIKMKDDKRFGGGSNAAEDFKEDIEEGEDDEDGDDSDLTGEDD